MDPDAALAKARDAIARYDAAESVDSVIRAACDAVEAFRALDEWLTKGGFRPGAWIPTGRAADVGHEIPDPPDWPQ